MVDRHWELVSGAPGEQPLTWDQYQRAVAQRGDAAERPVWRLGAGGETDYEERAQKLLDDVVAARPTALQRVAAWVPDREAAAVGHDEARQVVARELGFLDWDELVVHARQDAAKAERAPSKTMSAAIEAIKAGDVRWLGGLLGRHPDLVSEPWGAGGTLLGAVTQPDVFGSGLGIELGVDRRCVELLIKAGSELDRPLSLAACFNRVELVELLLDAGAAVDVIEPWGITPLMTAIYHGAAEAADVLVERAVVPDNLWVAAGSGQVDRVAGWLTAGGKLEPEAGVPRPNLADVGWAPSPPLDPDDQAGIVGDAFVFACSNGRQECAQLLLERGADIDAGPYLGLTGLHLAVMGDRRDIVSWLLEQGADTSRRDDIYGSTPEGWATHLGRPEVAELLA